MFGDGGVSVLNRWHNEICISFQSPLTIGKGSRLGRLIAGVTACAAATFLLRDKLIYGDIHRQGASAQTAAGSRRRCSTKILVARHSKTMPALLVSRQLYQERCGGLKSECRHNLFPLFDNLLLSKTVKSAVRISYLQRRYAKLLILVQ